MAQQISRNTKHPYKSIFAAAVLAKHAEVAASKQVFVEPIVEHTQDNPHDKLVKVGYCEEIGCYIEQ